MAVRRHWHRSINVPQVKRTPIRAFFLLYKAQPNNHVPAVDCLSWYPPPTYGELYGKAASLGQQHQVPVGDEVLGAIQHRDPVYSMFLRVLGGGGPVVA